MDEFTCRGFGFVRFNKSEKRNYLEWRRRHRQLAETLREGDAVVLVSKQRNQIVFALGFHKVEDNRLAHPVRTHLVFRTVKLVISGHIDENGHEHGKGDIFNHKMLGEYAKRAGLKLRGTKDLIEHLGWVGGDFIHPALVHRALRLVR